MNFEVTNRLKKLPPYLFARIDKIKEEEQKKGRKLIPLGIGDPDLPTPDFIIDRLVSAAKNPANHQYPSYWGMKTFRKSVAQWYESRFNSTINPDNEVLALIGSKEGIAHIPLAFINPGDVVLVPDPGYPVYEAATYMADGIPVRFALKEENDYLPDFAELERLVKAHPKAKMIFFNYPNNPTAATATVELFEEMAQFGKKHGLLVCHDNAYSEVFYDGKRQPSFMQAPTAKEIGIEFNSLSKTFNMTGWRVGMAVGNKSVIEGLAQVKTNIDSGIFNACQEAGIAAMENSEPFCTQLREIYQKRRDTLIPALQAIGLQCRSPDATFYAWAKLPKGASSEDFVLNLIRNTGIVATPGTGFGTMGTGYVRFTLCSDIAVLKEVAEILRKSL